ncbi:MAG: PIG-L family deacetylase [Oligoflexus sp.]|nr:PIG-L family deacetylase [Oligoflexus sp.]
MNSVEFKENKDLWFNTNAQWPHFVCPIAGKKLVLLIPHPDDEIFGCAGLLQQWASVATETVVIYVTAGEASHGFVDADEKASLARMRRQESQRALDALDLHGDVRICELNIPDSEVKSFEAQLKERLRFELDSSCVLIAPYYRDGHSDYDAVGECAKHLAEAIGFEIYFYPIWLWFWTHPSAEHQVDNFQKLPMNQRQLVRKVRAMECFESQIHAEESRSPVISKEFLEHYHPSLFEILVVH